MLHKVLNAGILFAVLSPIWGNEKMLGPANVEVLRMEQCPDEHLYTSSITVERKKISRTIDEYNALYVFDREIGKTVGTYVNLAKWGDGGWKENFYVMYDVNMCDFSMKYTERNTKKVLELMGVPPRCPLAKGTYKIVGLQVNTADLPQNLTYGEFRIDIYATDITEFNKPFLCVRLYVNVTPQKQT